MSELPKIIACAFLEKNAERAMLHMADHIEALEKKVEQLERFLPQHLRAPTVPQPPEDDVGKL